MAVISDAERVWASDAGQLPQLGMKFQKNIKEYDRLSKLGNRVADFREKNIYLLTNIVEILRKIKKIYEESPQKDSEKIRQTLKRIERLVNIYEMKLNDWGLPKR